MIIPITKTLEAGRKEIGLQLAGKGVTVLSADEDFEMSVDDKGWFNARSFFQPIGSFSRLALRSVLANTVLILVTDVFIQEPFPEITIPPIAPENLYAAVITPNAATQTILHGKGNVAIGDSDEGGNFFVPGIVSGSQTYDGGFGVWTISSATTAIRRKLVIQDNGGDGIRLKRTNVHANPITDQRIVANVPLIYGQDDWFLMPNVDSEGDPDLDYISVLAYYTAPVTFSQAD